MNECLTFNHIRREILSLITPSDEETRRCYRIFDEIKESIEGVVKGLGYPYAITLEGSLVKGTHLRGETDLDIFVLIRYKDMNEEWLEDLVNKLFQALINYNPRKLYASHPYIRLFIEDIEVDVVPAYMAYSIDEVRTAVDRTPFHTRFVKEKLGIDKVDEVRLLKKFFKGIGVYGAEIKTEGFSGYLTELLIIYYGSFLDAIRGIAKWNPPQVVDIVKLYPSTRDYVVVYGNKPLIVPDPVDPRRNAAAALSLKSFSKAVLAAREFLEKPSTKFFIPPTKSISWDSIIDYLKRRESEVVGYLITFPHGTSPDIIWGELKKCLRRGLNILKSHQFTVVDCDVWCDEVSKALILYEVQPRRLPSYTLHAGPKVFRFEDVGKFLGKYTKRDDVVGPWINEYGELVIMKRRKYVEPYEVLINEAKNILSMKHLMNYSVVRIEDLKELFMDNNNLRVWLSNFVDKRSPWLD